ncbi:hypothetical protein DRP04_00260 [Archaeoglobales archaeon]|jgi:regulator of replication initiation timing|nr:MAG: hypothetical protein DRP04_00260 [Archaeoglobales archaeon]
MDVEKAIKRLFDAYARLLDRVNKIEKDVKAIKENVDWLMDELRVQIREIEEMGKYKRENCANLVNGKCTMWQWSITKQPLRPSKVWCAVCWMYKKREVH